MPPSTGVNAHSPSSSLSSFSMLTSTPSSSDPFEAFDESSSDEDEIVWTANEFDPDEDFILVPQSHHAPPSSATDPRPASHDHDEPPHVVHALSRLSLADPDPNPTTPTTSTFPTHARPTHLGCKARRSAGAHALASTAPAHAPRTHRGRRRRGKRDAAASYPSPSPSPVRELVEDTREGVMGQGGFGARPLVEESDDESEPVIRGYEDAVRYITSFLSNPSAALSCSAYTRLTFLQSLIIELGLLAPSSALPSSLKAAKRFLKARAFINIGEYLHVRGQGIDKLREVMFSNKRELTTDLRRKKGGRKADKGWVKRHGLNVLLVSVF